MAREALREARLAAGLSLRQVADAADLDPSSICHFERGRFNPSPKALERWRQALRGLMEARTKAITETMTQL